MSILSALNNPALSRLKETWRALPPKYLSLRERLDTLMTPLQNHKSYRTIVSHRLEQELPTIPLIGLILRDLAIIHETNPSHSDKSLFPCAKIYQLGIQISIIERAKLKPFPSSPEIFLLRDALEADLAVQIGHLPQDDTRDDVIWNLSKFCEASRAAEV